MPKTKLSYIYNKNNMSIGIYKIINPNKKIYIGQSVCLENREKTYKTLNSGVKGQPKLYRSIVKYGWEQHMFEIIEECNLDKLNEREIYWGLYYDVLGENGLNLRLGNGRGQIHDELKKQISDKHKGMKKPWAGKNKKLSDEHKNKLSLARKSTSNPIFQYDLQGNFIKKWLNPKQASNTLKINNGYLHTIIDNPNKTLNHYRFTSIFYDTLPSITKWHNKKKQVLQYDKHNNLIQTWESAKLASLYYNIKVQSITACCRGIVKSCNNYIWKYA